MFLIKNYNYKKSAWLNNIFPRFNSDSNNLDWFQGGLLFFTIVLIGSGWAFIKHILSSKEKRVFMVVLPLQVGFRITYQGREGGQEGGGDSGMKQFIFYISCTVQINCFNQIKLWKSSILK